MRIREVLPALSILVLLAALLVGCAPADGTGADGAGAEYPTTVAGARSSWKTRKRGYWN